VRNFSERFFGRETVHFLRASIPINDPVLMIANDDCVVGQIEEPRLFSQASFGLFLFGDVACNFRNADNFPFRVFDRRNRQRNIDQLSILPATNRFVVIQRFTMANFSQNLLFFALPVFRNQSQDGFANDLFWFVSKDVFGALIPIGDDSIQSFCHDRVLRRLDYRDQTHGGCLRSFALGDVKQTINCASGFAAFVGHNPRRWKDVSFFPVRTFDNNFQVFRCKLFAA
jgi:hypothetical protein